jgi:hypothetical protein
MGIWGSGTLDNDDAVDWLAELASSDEPSLPSRCVTCLLEDREQGAAEVIAASIGRQQLDLPEIVTEWLDRVGYVASPADLVEAALFVDYVVTQPSEFRDLWEESENSEWLESLKNLKMRLQDRGGGRRRPDPRSGTRHISPLVGDLIKVTTPSGKIAYLQFICDSKFANMIRILPGLFDEALSTTELEHLAAIPDGARTLAQLKDLLNQGHGEIVGNVTVPDEVSSHPALRSLARAIAPHPEGWIINDIDGQTFTDSEFRDLHPDIDTRLLPFDSIPTTKTLLIKIDDRWTPEDGVTSKSLRE